MHRTPEVVQISFCCLKCLLSSHLRGEPSPAPVVDLPEEGAGRARTEDVFAADQHQGSVVETSQAAHRHPGRAQAVLDQAGPRHHQEHDHRHQDVDVGVEGGAGQGGLGLVLSGDGVVCLPGCPAVLALQRTVQEEAGDGVEGRLGEVLLVESVLLHTADHHQVGLLPQLVEPQGVRDPLPALSRPPGSPNLLQELE